MCIRDRFQGTNGSFYGTAYGGGVNGYGIVFAILANQTPKIPPTIIGSTTVFTPVSNPLFYAVQAVQSQSTSVNGLIGALAKPVTAPTTTSFFTKALAYFLPSFLTQDSTPTNWILSGTLPPNLTFNSASGTATGTPVATPGIYTFSVTPQNAYAAGTQRTVCLLYTSRCV